MTKYRNREGGWLTLSDAAEPWDVLPRQAGVDERLQGIRVSMSEPDRTRLASYADSPRDTLILLDILALLHFGTRRVVDLLHAHVLLTATKLGRVDGDKEALDATRLCVLDVLLRDLAVAVDIELEEERLVVGLGVEDVVEGARRERSDLSGGVSTMSAIGRGGEVGRAI